MIGQSGPIYLSGLQDLGQGYYLEDNQNNSVTETDPMWIEELVGGSCVWPQVDRRTAFRHLLERRASCSPLDRFWDRFFREFEGQFEIFGVDRRC